MPFRPSFALWTCWALGLAPSLSPAQPQGSGRAFSDTDLKAAAALRERALKGTGAYAIVASLTTEVGPRPAGSEGDRAAVAWALTTLKELGFQNVRAQDVTVPRWARGAAEASIVSPWPQSLVAAALGGSVGTPEEGIQADVVQVADLEALKKLPRARVEGRIVFFNKRPERTRDGQGYSAPVRARVEGASAAAALGAVAMVIRSIGTDNDRLPHTGSMRYAPQIPRIPAAALSNPDADMLERQLASGRPVAVKLKLTSRDLGTARSANVIGEIPGTQTGDTRELVLLGAHLDSWDLGTGALDDGAGVAIVIEAARLVREMKLTPKRTLRVVLFANEEFGASGATVYAAQAQSSAELARHVVAMEADLGAGPVWRLETRVAEAALASLQPLAAALRPLGIERGSNTTDGGVDVHPLNKLGVPLFDLTHDGSKYFDYHHTPNDTLDKVDPKALDQSVAAYAVAAWLAASMNGDFGRAPPPAAAK